MTSPQRPVLAPQHVLRFSCIGPDCEDTCCQGWRVAIDEGTYKLYRRLQHPELRPLLDKAIKRNRSNPTPRNYAKLKLDEKGMCPLLSSEGLCRVHKELGVEYLSTVCAVYPRITHSVDHTLERSLTLSCPEAARLALLNPEPMEFAYHLEPTRVRTEVMRSVNTRDVRTVRKLERHFWDVRRFVIGLLQDRSYAVWERMVILGLFMQKVEQLEGEGYQSLGDLVERYRAAVEDGSLRQSLAGIPTQGTIQIKLALAPDFWTLIA